MKKPLDIKKVIESFKDVHGKTYDYSLVEYKNNKSKVKIICEEHGIYYQTPFSHKQGSGCPKCGQKKKADKRKSNTSYDSVLSSFIEVHNNNYNYDQVKYDGLSKKVDILCNNCNKIFKQAPDVHKNGHGCPFCKYERTKRTKKDKYGDENYNNLEQTKKTNLKKYGVEHKSYLGNNCIYKKYDFTLPSGKVIKYQGYEHYLLKELLESFNEDDLILDWKYMPEFTYINEKGKTSRYFPDVFVKSTNTIYEVKSEYTLNNSLFNNIQKFKSVYNSEYNFELCIYDNKGNNIKPNKDIIKEYKGLK